ncbi:MAG: hypothetical protein ACI8WB_003966 [Phenylobacterium sp.]|jgi:hypothetical protein
MKQLLQALALLIFSSPLLAAPEILTIDSSASPKSSDRYIRRVHKEIPTPNQTVAINRFTILQAMLTTKGYAWTYEGEGDGFLLARFDYRGDTIIMKIEYNDALIQLKYHKAWGDYVCENDIAGVCYENANGYYKYVKNLRRSIELQAKRT